MTIADIIDQFTPVELTQADLGHLGIDVPREFVDAWLNTATTITIRVYDTDGASYDEAPCNDNSGSDSWEWIQWDRGRKRDEWLVENFACEHCGEMPPYESETCEFGEDGHDACDAFRPGLDFWIERYEHGLVRYAPTGESSQVDRQWDVAPGVAIMRFKEDHGCGDVNDPDGLLNFVRAVCDEYTAWCNGDYYGMIRWELTQPTDPLGILAPEDFEPHWAETDSCWGFLGSSYAERTARGGDW